MQNPKYKLIVFILTAVLLAGCRSNNVTKSSFKDISSESSSAQSSVSQMPTDSSTSNIVSSKANSQPNSSPENQGEKGFMGWENDGAANSIGNSVFNIMHHSKVAAQGDSLYIWYRDHSTDENTPTQNYSLFRIAHGCPNWCVLHEDASPSNFNVLGDKIYYTKSEEQFDDNGEYITTNYIYCATATDTDFGRLFKSKILLKKSADHMIVVNDKIVFISSHSNGAYNIISKIYMCDTNGKNLKDLSNQCEEENLFNLSFVGATDTEVYFAHNPRIDSYDEACVYRINLNNGIVSKVLSGYSETFVHNNTIYYNCHTNSILSYNFCRSKIGSSTVEKIRESQTNIIGADDNWIYFKNKYDSYVSGRLNVNSLKFEKIYDCPALPYMFGEWAVYYDEDSSSYYIKNVLSGSTDKIM